MKFSMQYVLRSARVLAIAAAACVAISTVKADEGMWTFDRIPAKQLKASHGVELSQSWLTSLQRAAVAYGSSASFVSQQGLMLTNHHVALRCLAQVSSAKNDYTNEGFLAATLREEIPCPNSTARSLIDIEDVTESLTKSALSATSDEQRNSLRKAEVARLETACAQEKKFYCNVVAFYGGAVQKLYRYQQWDDVRLVFAPEYQAAFYGGDPDNFVFPRFALDFALFRVYENGKPVRPEYSLKLARTTLKEGDLVFVAGHPNTTQRLLTHAQLIAQRDVHLPLRIASAKAQQSMFHAYSKTSPEAARQALDFVFDTENWLKNMLGQHAALTGPELVADKQKVETEFRKEYAKQGLSGDPWHTIDQATELAAMRAKERWAVNYGYRSLLSVAGELVEIAYEKQLKEGDRLSFYRNTALPATEKRIKANVPIYAEFEMVRLASKLLEAQQILGTSHPYVQLTLNGSTPDEVAKRLVTQTRAADPAWRAMMLDGGVPAIEASTDPMIQLARKIYPMRRAILREEEEKIDAPLRSANGLLARARFRLYGDAIAPDATATLRLSYGVVAGYQSKGATVPWKTTWGGWLARADSFDAKPPFNLPPSISKSRNLMNPSTPLNFVSTADISGGNSGSPVVNKDGEWVGLLFDSNLEALGGPFGYSDQSARSLSVHAMAILESLSKVYGAQYLANELMAR
jgi:Peptidase S46